MTQFFMPLQWMEFQHDVKLQLNITESNLESWFQWSRSHVHIFLQQVCPTIISQLILIIVILLTSYYPAYLQLFHYNQIIYCNVYIIKSTIFYYVVDHKEDWFRRSKKFMCLSNQPVSINCDNPWFDCSLWWCPMVPYKSKFFI